MVTTPFPACSCGCGKPHAIAGRDTADGERVTVWSDGAVTQGRFGAWLPGLGQPRSRWGASTRAQATRLLMNDFGALDFAEIPCAIKLAQATYAHTWSNDDDRRRWVLSRVKLKKEGKI